MKAFSYERATSAADAAAKAARQPGAKFIAGGTNLLDLMKLQIETPSHLIDVNGLSLDTIDATPEGGLRIGALVRNTDLAADARVRRDYAVLSRALLAGASASCAIARPRRAICCSARVARIFTTPISRATSACLEVVARPLAASTVNWR
ncbi:aerobic-type carbon monoxide dehydrogenase, middle subunit CoxM/CutM-like protein [Xanthomonas vesicatoria ATCC 35937]|uniref:Aerobic-type carbon monoxide dehydrogenase, middle subunit CoxM/CutM-like protein n=1 Tax=Xanthomonas vesicatoria ATCC 35937 TaxID=925775 RepID=F0BL62_9XANT|nr:aerobic-type carbon monoxide dehydrogenase, middle subunit CoxM/CutM-like protein [Xanthomonas vesicatoria ATCC 35937]